MLLVIRCGKGCLVTAELCECWGEARLSATGLGEVRQCIQSYSVFVATHLLPLLLPPFRVSVCPGISVFAFLFLL